MTFLIPPILSAIGALEPKGYSDTPSLMSPTISKSPPQEHFMFLLAKHPDYKRDEQKDTSTYGAFIK